MTLVVMSVAKELDVTEMMSVLNKSGIAEDERASEGWHREDHGSTVCG